MPPRSTAATPSVQARSRAGRFAMNWRSVVDFLCRHAVRNTLLPRGPYAEDRASARRHHYYVATFAPILSSTPTRRVDNQAAS